MQITSELIERFFENNCSPDEAAFVADYLRLNPGIAEKYLRKDWDSAATQSALPAGLKTEIWAAIQKQTIRPARSTIHRRVFWISAAASILLIAGIWAFFPAQRTGQKAIYVQETGPQAVQPNEWTSKSNTGSTPVTCSLPDGSEITMSPGSELRYPSPFSREGRDIFLKGEALFKVSKDSLRPFTVHAGDFATTALGTVFRVADRPDGCTIKLLEGKIRIRSLKKELKGWTKDLILLPGQGMNYHSADGSFAVTGSKKQKTSPAPGKQELNSDGTEINFENTVLPEAFKKLSKHFSQQIVYDEKELSGMYFSGTVLKADSLNVILNVIAQMNSLTVKKNENGFIVKKSQ
jgi:transmembrane sensor